MKTEMSAFLCLLSVLQRGQPDSIRPIAVGEVWLRLVSLCTLAKVSPVGAELAARPSWHLRNSPSAYAACFVSL